MLTQFRVAIRASAVPPAQFPIGLPVPFFSAMNDRRTKSAEALPSTERRGCDGQDSQEDHLAPSKAGGSRAAVNIGNALIVASSMSAARPRD